MSALQWSYHASCVLNRYEQKFHACEGAPKENRNARRRGGGAGYVPKMTNKAAHPNVNALLAALTTEQRRHFLDVATPVNLKEGKVLTDSEQPIQDVFFPTTAVLSILSVMTNKVAVETAVVGYEGMAPLGAFHQVDRTAEQVIVQVPGEALRMSRQAFHTALADVPAMRPVMHRFSQALFTFAAQSSGCNRQHSVVQRCARWLMTTHDRVPGDEFYLTHLFLSQMLGVRRSSVTIAAEVLRAAGAITYTRGKVRILDRAILQSRACECYTIIRSTYDRLLGGGSTPSPLADLALSDGENSLVGGGAPIEPRTSPPYGLPLSPDASFTEFSTQLREAKQRSEQLRALADAGEAEVDHDDVLRLSDELSVAFEQLEVAEEEMRAQMLALEEMRMAMETQQQLWRARFDGLPDAFIETDQDETIIELNRAAEDLLGRPRNRVVGKPLTTLFLDTDRRALRNVISQLRGGARTAQWTGTVLSNRDERPDVDVAVAATSTPNAPPGTEFPNLGARYHGARWLLRPVRIQRRSVS
jgi:PAS domain S-box-containing protein